jgi:hypothetical protein
MAITFEDIRRAVSGMGDVSAYAEIYQQALGGSPIPITTQFNSPVKLPPFNIMLSRTDHGLADPICKAKNEMPDNDPAAGRIDLKIIPAAPYGEKTSYYVKQAIDEIKPDIIFLDCFPVEFAAGVLYTFSLPCAAGLPLQASIRYPVEQEEYLSSRFYPGNLIETAVISGWLQRISLWPVGKPPEPVQLTYVPSQGYVDLNYTDTVQWQSALKPACQSLRR